MTKQEYRNHSLLFFFFSIWNFCLMIQAMLTKTGLDRIFFCTLFGFSFFINLRLAVHLYRKSRYFDLK